MARASVWLSSPGDFCDPYDSSFALIQAPLLQEQLRIAIRSRALAPLFGDLFSEEDVLLVSEALDPVLAMAGIACQRDERLARLGCSRIADALKAASESIGDEHVEGVRRQIRGQLRIACFSERLDSLPMWTHYAANHAGFCVEYEFCDLSRTDPRRRSLMPVIYSEELFDATRYFEQGLSHASSINPFVAIIAALHKALDWAYEREWRLVVPFDSVGPEYWIPSPRRVYVGAMASGDTEKELLDITRRMRVPVFRMRLSSHAFMSEADALLLSGPT